MENIRRSCAAEQAGQTVNVENEQTIVVKKAARRKYRTTPIWQYDTGHVLAFEGFELPEWFEVHFARDSYEEAVTQIGQNDQVDLPDMYAQTAGVIRAWMWIADQETETGLTKFEIEIPVFRRAQPSDVEPTPVEQGVIDQAIAALNAGVTRSETAADAAEDAQEAAEQAKAAAQAAADLATEEAAGAAGSERAAAGSATAAAASAEAAAGSAASAAESAAAAAASATDLETAVTQAQAAATMATGKAQEANYAAQAASGSAGTASTAAARATGAADGAEQSATGAAGSAAAAAGSATAAGQSATAAAGSATTAGAAAQTATEKAAQTEQIADEFAEDIADLKSALNLKITEPETPGTAGQVLSLDSNLDPVWVDQEEVDESGLAPVIKSSASGEIASFADGADGRNIDSLIVNITPVQDLHGQEAPYPPGGGKNLVDCADPQTITSQTIVAEYETNEQVAFTLSATIVNNTSITGSLKLYAYLDGTYVGERAVQIPEQAIATRYSTTYNLSGVTYNKLRIVVAGASAGYSLTVSKVQLEKGSTATAYAPYSNICPISGWTGANVQAAGKNLADYPNMISAGAVMQEDGSLYVESTAIFSNSANAFKNNGYSGQITVSIKVKNNADTTSRGLVPKIYYTDGTAHELNVTYASTYTTFTRTSAADKIVDHVGFTYGSGATKTWFYLMIELGSTASSYEPYQGRTIPVSWQSVAGTVYGGTLDVISGVLTVDQAEVDLGSLTWELRSTGLYRSEEISDIKTVSAQSEPVQGLAEKYRVYSYSYAKDHLDEFVIGMNSNGDKRLFVSGGAPGSGKFVYELAEPVQYQLSPNTLTTLLGQNNIWSNCGSIESVQYSADTKTYVDDAIPAVPVQDVQVNGTSVVQDGVANVPMAGTGLGVVKYAAGYGVTVTATGILSIVRAPDTDIKAGAGAQKPITPQTQPNSVFYGLAKAAGSDEKNSTLPVGQYTDSAKSAIHEMLNGSVPVTGTTPTITALPGIRYVCGEVATLTITPTASGITDIVFESGSTATVLTISGTVKWANGFDPSSLDANTTYEINICDGLGVAVGWT